MTAHHEEVAVSCPVQRLTVPVEIHLPNFDGGHVAVFPPDQGIGGGNVHALAISHETENFCLIDGGSDRRPAHPTAFQPKNALARADPQAVPTIFGKDGDFLHLRRFLNAPKREIGKVGAIETTESRARGQPEISVLRLVDIPHGRVRKPMRHVPIVVAILAGGVSRIERAKIQSGKTETEADESQDSSLMEKRRSAHAQLIDTSR
ncbi:MAG TPA: hypothetical protein VHO24_14680 [Opitutaceae bacterium]|nr:hypothetical protein [Opitutaceae bacterium]